MKRILTTLCALALFAAGVATAFAAGYSQPNCYYPISVEEYTYGPLDEPRVNKIYQLSLSDDPGLIPTEDFERGGRRFYLLDMIRKNETGVDTQPYTETVTMDSDTGDLSAVLKELDGQMEVTTEDGYTGTLILDHTSVQVEVKGYQTSTKNLSATRVYPSLSDADLDFIPKTITDNGSTLTLADVQWANDGTWYTATAQYTGTSSSRYATGYTVTADYVGEVAKADCSVMIYTAIFGSMEIPKESDAPEESAVPVESDPPVESANPADTPSADTPAASINWAELKTPLMIGGIVLILGIGGAFALKKIRR